MVIRSFLKSGFQATLTSKMNVLGIWKEHFSVFCKFLSDEVETVFWESGAKPSKLFKSKFGQWKDLTKIFSKFLELKTNVLTIWKSNFEFFANLWMAKLEAFFGKVRQSVQNYLNQNSVIQSFLKKYFQGISSSKPNVLSVWKDHFSVFC